jgi:hypothetical protein
MVPSKEPFNAGLPGLRTLTTLDPISNHLILLLQ